MLTFLICFLLINLLCSFVGIAKVQNDNEGGKFSDLVALIALGLLAGAPLAGILFVSDFLSLLDQLKK